MRELLIPFGHTGYVALFEIEDASTVTVLAVLQGFTHHDLANVINAALAAKAIPGQFSRNLDAIRNIGNFAAHPMKDTNSGAIVEIEPEEAKWNLDVLTGCSTSNMSSPMQFESNWFAAQVDQANP